ncbi:protein NLRC5 isoform X5 [Passer montanus]|uniref:protein NLRC5 isoform X5 n=1 Tax=Passer montanus TaxID=9160 RepID=UPI0019615DE0|nr:protein NLRC5 isoform X5 [Passer montanus]
MQPPFQHDDLDLPAAVARARPQLVEFLSHCPEWLLCTAQRLVPEAALSSLAGIAHPREKISVLLDLLEEAGPAAWKHFAQSVCMEYDLPLDLEVLLMSSAGEGNFSQTEESGTDTRAQSSVPKGSARSRRSSSSGSDKDAKQRRLDACVRYRHLLVSSIRQRYGSRRAAEAQEQTQPLPFNQTFVNVVIHQSKAPRFKERAEKPREEVAGAPEAEECADTAVKVSDLLCSEAPSHTTKVIFLFGKPGTGKTRLMHRICQKWAEGVLPQFLYIFLFEFRQLNLLKRKLTLKELLFDMFLQPEDSPDAVFQGLLENAQQTLIIFDGLDEFAANMDVSSSSKRSPALTSPLSISQLFAELCHGNLLPGCTVLVTSRPKRLPDFLLCTVGVLAEIWGFDHERVEEYVSHYFCQHSFRERAIAHVKNNTKLLSMCLIPALCNIVCICLEYLLLKHQMSVELPQTMTQFYIKMFLIFLNKQQGDCAGDEETQVNCNKKAILGLFDLALKSLEEKKLVFYVHDIPEDVKEFASLHGLLTVFEVKTSGTCPEAGYAFVHLSLQEFFAALCLMVSRRVDKNYLKKKFFLKSKWTLKNETKTEFMESFHIFLSGLSSRECRTFLMLLAEQDEAWVQEKQDVILQSLKKLAATHLSGPKVLELCHCTFETQNLEVAQHIGSLLNFKYEFKNFRLTTLDMSALVFVINSSQDLICLDFAGCLVDTDCLEVLAGCKNVEHLSFRSRRCGDDFAAALSKGLQGMGSLKKLELTGGSITAEGMTGLVQAAAQCLQLEEINLQGNRIRDPDGKRVMDLFSKMEKLKKVDLSNNHLSLNAVLSLAKEGIVCQNVTELCARGDTMVIYFSGTSGTAHRSPDLKLEEKKEENKEHIIPTRHVNLCLQDHRLLSQHAKMIVAILQSCPCLSEVDLSGNKLGDEGCSCLLESLPCLSISKQLNLSQNLLSVSGICSLLKSVNTCQKVMEVQVSLCHGTAVLRFREDREFASLPPREEPVFSTDDQPHGEESQTPTTPQKIRLTDCNFQASDLKNVCAVLKECGHISELDLSQNFLGDEGLLQLFQCLPKLKMLRSLKFNNNQISLNSVFFLAESLTAPEHIKTMSLSLGHPQVVHLTFWERVSSTSRWRSGSLACPKQEGRGQSFSLRDCRMALEDVTRLCQILAQCPQLTEIDLSGNSLSDQSIERLLSFLPSLCHLTLLSIRKNSLSPRCAVLLLNSINLCERVRVVEVRSSENAFLHLGASMQSQKTSCRLTGCAIGEGQVEELCSVLEQHGWLAEVDLSRNQLGDEGLRCLLDHLHRVPGTCSLNLSHNGISQDGVLHLINAFVTSGNTTEVQVSLCSKATLIIKLTSGGDPRKILRLAECNFQPEHLEKLFLLLERCTGLTEYTSSNNNMTVQAAERLLHSLRKDLGLLKIRICKDKTLFQLVIRFPPCLEKTESVISRLSLHKPETKHSFCQRLCEKCAQLQQLRWSHMELHEDEAEMLVRIFLPLPELKVFGLTSCSVAPAGIDYLISGLQSCQAIEELNLGYMKLSSAAIPELVLGLCEMPSLKRFILNHNSIGDDGCSRLAEALRKMHSMEEINLSHNEIGDPGLLNLAAVLLEMQNLQKIDLSGNCPSPAGGEKLMEALAHCKHIKELLLSRNGFGDRTAVTLPLCLPHMANLKILHFQNNNIGQAGGLELARALVVCGLLEEISLSENDLGEQSIHALSKGLPCFKRLRRIDLKFCGITDGASKSLSLGFQQCPSMEEIILSWNALGDGGARELAIALPKMEKLKVLDLEQNRIGACGATRLAEELATCPEIQSIRLWGNPVPKGLPETLTSQDPRLCFSFN